MKLRISLFDSFKGFDIKYGGYYQFISSCFVAWLSVTQWSQIFLKAQEFVADSHQFQTCLAIFGIKGNDDEDDDTDANPTEGDDWVITEKQLFYVPPLPPPLMADDDGSRV